MFLLCINYSFSQNLDSLFAVAKQTKAILEKHELSTILSSSGKHSFYINTNKTVLEEILKDVSINFIVAELNF